MVIAWYTCMLDFAFLTWHKAIVASNSIESKHLHHQSRPKLVQSSLSSSYFSALSSRFRLPVTYYYALPGTTDARILALYSTSSQAILAFFFNERRGLTCEAA